MGRCTERREVVLALLQVHFDLNKKSPESPCTSPDTVCDKRTKQQMMDVSQTMQLIKNLKLQAVETYTSPFSVLLACRMSSESRVTREFRSFIYLWPKLATTCLWGPVKIEVWKNL